MVISYQLFTNEADCLFKAISSIKSCKHTTVGITKVSDCWTVAPQNCHTRITIAPSNVQQSNSFEIPQKVSRQPIDD